MVDVKVTKSRRMTTCEDGDAIPGLNTTTAIILWLLMTTIGPVALLTATDPSAPLPNTLGWALLGFNNLNMLIAICEIILGAEIKQIQADYQRNLKVYSGPKQYEAAFEYLFLPMNVSTLFSAKTWSKMWSTYALWDPSYQNQESFGFFIDVGNGWSTIPPCVLWNIAIVCPALLESSFGSNAYLWVGVLGCCSYWQILYGTIIYFLSFIFNKRYETRPIVEVCGFVGIANGIWFIFPIIALYASVVILKHQDFSIFG